MYNSILKLINLSFDTEKRNIIVIKDFQNASTSTIKLIEFAIKNQILKNVFFVFLVDSVFDVYFEENQYKINFFEYVQRNNYIMDYYDNNIKLSFKNKKYSFIKNIAPELILRFIEENFIFLALENIEEHLEDLIENYKKFPFDKLQLNKLLFLLAQTYYYENNISKSLNVCNLILKESLKLKKYDSLGKAYRLISLIYHEKGNSQQAKKFAELSISALKNIKNKKLMFLSKLQLFAVKYKNFNNMNEEFFSEFTRLEKEGNELNFVIVLYELYKPIFMCDYVEEKEEYFDKSIKYYSYYGNKQIMAAVYHLMGLYLSKKKQKHEESFKYYEKSLELKSKIEDPYELLKVFNGIGYEYFKYGEYYKAFKSYEKILPILREIESFDEILAGFYNIGIMYLYCFDNYEALYWFENIIYILKILNKETIPFHSIHQIYSILGILYIKTDQILKAFNCIHEIEKVSLSKLDDHDSYFYYLWFKALFAEQENNIKATAEYYKKVETFLNSSSEWNIYLSRYYYETGIFYKKIGNLKKAKLLFSRGLSVSEKLNYKFYRKVLLNEIENIENVNYKNIHYKLQIFKFNLNNIIEKARKGMVVDKLYNKVEEMNFLNSIQEILLNLNLDKYLMIERLIENINSVFLIDYTVFVLFENKIPKIITNLHKLDKKIFKVLENISFNNLEEKLYLQNEIPSVVQKHFHNLGTMMIIPMYENGELVFVLGLGNNKKQIDLNEDMLRIFSVISKQIKMAVLNRDTSSKLKEANKRIISQQRRLLDEAYNKGIIEVNSGIIHNIGNIVSSVYLRMGYWKNIYKENKEKETKIIEDLIFKTIQEGKENDLEKLKEVFPEFISLVKEQNEYDFKELEFFEEKTEQIKDIIYLQQNFIGQLGTENYYHIESILNEVIMLYSNSIKKREIEVILEIINNKQILCDKTQIIQIIGNILKNAYEELENTPKFIKKIHIRAFSEQSNLIVSIKDNGRGIDSSIRNRIFEFGFSTKKNGGRGFGLHSCKTIVNKYGGDIRIYSEKDKGTDFQVILPAKK